MPPSFETRRKDAALLGMRLPRTPFRGQRHGWAIPSERNPHRWRQMKLNDEEQEILAGRHGALALKALQHQLKVGEFFGAEDFVPVTQAHIMADTESLGEVGVRWLEQLAAASDEAGGVRVPTITDPRGTDFAKAAFLGQTPAML